MTTFESGVRAAANAEMSELTDAEINAVAGGESAIVQLAKEAAHAALLCCGTITTHATTLK